MPVEELEVLDKLLLTTARGDESVGRRVWSTWRTVRVLPLDKLELDKLSMVFLYGAKIESVRYHPQLPAFIAGRASLFARRECVYTCVSVIQKTCLALCNQANTM